MSKIKTVTNDKKLIITSRPPITSGSRNVDELSVVFDKTWDYDEALYYVNFYTDDENDGVIRRLDMSGNTGTCSLPEYITREDGFFHFGVFAKADDDIVKTSDVVGYEVKKGACIAPTGDEHDTVSEIRRRFIDLLNANVQGISLNYGMRFEDIDMTFTTRMSELYSTLQTYISFASGLFTLVREYINPDVIEIDDPTMQFLACFVELENYLRDNSSMSPDSVGDDALIKTSLLNIIRTYIDPDFDENSEMLDYCAAISEYIQNSSQAVEDVRLLLNSLYSFYTGGNT